MQLKKLSDKTAFFNKTNVCMIKGAFLLVIKFYKSVEEMKTFCSNNHLEELIVLSIVLVDVSFSLCELVTNVYSQLPSALLVINKPQVMSHTA